MAGVTGASPSTSVFLVDSTHLPMPITGNPPFPSNPIYAQPLYEAGLDVLGTTYNVLYIATLNGEVYAYDADNAAVSATSSCPGRSSGCIWFRDENNVAGMNGLKHNCDTGTGFGESVVSGLPNFLNFAGTISTPVIQPKGSAAAIYVTNLCQRPDFSEHWYITALSLTTGANLGTPVEIAYTATVPNGDGPQQVFTPAHQLQRSGLLSISSSSCTSPPCRSVIASFGTAVNETAVQYQGWMFTYDSNSPATLPAQANPYTTQCYYPAETINKPVPCSPLPDGTPPNQCGQGGGIWMYARGAAANTNGEVFTVAGNGGFNYCPTCTHQCMPSGNPMSGFTDIAEAVVDIQMSAVWNYSGTGPAPFWPSDYFVPSSIPVAITGAGYADPGNCFNSSGASAPCTYFQVLNDYDWDLGTTGAVLFEDLYQSPGADTASNTAMVLVGNKRGDGYVLLQSSLGQYHTTLGDQATAEFNLAQTTTNALCTDSGLMQGQGQCDQPVTLGYWKRSGDSSLLVAWPWHETLSSYQWTNAGSGYNFNLAFSTSSPLPGGGLGGYGGGTLAITANQSDPSLDAIVWASVFPQSCSNRAHDPYSGAGRGCPGYLLAYKLDSVSGALTLIWPSPLPSTQVFEPAPYAIPTAVNGYVYAPAYGLYDAAHSNYDLSGVQAYVF